MKAKQLIILCSLFFTLSSIVSTTALAEEKLAEEQKKPDADKEDPLSGADVTIIKDQKGRVIEESRINGRLVQVKITPKNGYPYYLIDTDADGNLDVRSSSPFGSSTQINTWKIYEW